MKPLPTIIYVNASFECPAADGVACPWVDGYGVHILVIEKILRKEEPREKVVSRQPRSSPQKNMIILPCSIVESSDSCF